MPAEITIRPATAKDVPTIQRLYRQLDQHHVRLLPEVFQSVAGHARPDAFVAEKIANEDSDYLLAEVQGKVRGFVDLRMACHPHYPMFRPHNFALVDNAVVEEGHRGQGIGTALFNAAKRWARERGLRYMQTEVWHENAGAHAFYARQGFHPRTTRMELEIKENEE
jgi:ribosomal protein S18 acetylase RimI-like enzyme